MSEIHEVADTPQETHEISAQSAAADLLTLGGHCFFKNAVVYRLPEDFVFSALELEEALNARRLTDCGRIEEERSGWVNSSPLGRTVHAVNGQFLIAMGLHKKILPASAVREEFRRRAAELANEQGHPLSRKQKQELKETVRSELLAKAMVRTTATRAWLDTKSRWLAVEASGAARAERLVEELRDTLGSLAVQQLDTEDAPAFTMGSWLRAGEAPGGLSLDTDLELKGQDKATVRYAHHPLDGADIKKHLDEGKVVTRLGLTWNDRIAFILTGSLELKRISFLELDEAAEGEDEGEKVTSPEEVFEADFILMSEGLSLMLADLSLALGITVKSGEAANSEAAKAA